ncbi:hypothetical protein P7K49_009034 [Saguinus oedipus]|uniref:Uncharacterized protein n=1 Tax=Saguinus oedipus TaxID=9490 RepID=A0ABQ9VZD3_SAGOE|nr:hypothetical protein P7K49_009034 [Saguinus oedipus]
MEPIRGLEIPSARRQGLGHVGPAGRTGCQPSWSSSQTLGSWGNFKEGAELEGPWKTGRPSPSQVRERIIQPTDPEHFQQEHVHDLTAASLQKSSFPQDDLSQLSMDFRMWKWSLLHFTELESLCPKKQAKLMGFRDDPNYKIKNRKPSSSRNCEKGRNVQMTDRRAKHQGIVPLPGEPGNTHCILGLKYHSFCNNSNPEKLTGHEYHCDNVGREMPGGARKTETQKLVQPTGSGNPGLTTELLTPQRRTSRADRGIPPGWGSGHHKHSGKDVSRGSSEDDTATNVMSSGS